MTGNKLSPPKIFMADVTVSSPSQDELKRIGVDGWGIWEKEESTFDWSYDEKETCYILVGEAEVSYGTKKVSFKAGDLVVFPQGLDVTWRIKKGIRKRYLFG
jgi:uncharacterized cupin superfamily protein